MTWFHGFLFLVLKEKLLAIKLWTYENVVTQSCLTLCDPWSAACQAPLSVEFSRQEYWSGLPFPSPERKVTQSSPTLCNPMNYTVHGILQARIVEWAVFPFSRRSSQPRYWTRSPALQVDSLPAEPQGKPKNTGVGGLSLLQQIFLTQELNQGLLHCKWIFYQLRYQGSCVFKSQWIKVNGKSQWMF